MTHWTASAVALLTAIRPRERAEADELHARSLPFISNVVGVNFGNKGFRRKTRKIAERSCVD
jgi:hypothetical protein